MRPTLASTFDSRPFEKSRDLAQPSALSPFGVDAGNNIMLVNILDQTIWIDRVWHPSVRTTVRARHSPAIRLMVPHRSRCALPNLVANQRIERRQDRDKELPHGTAGVDCLGQ